MDKDANAKVSQSELKTILKDTGKGSAAIIQRVMTDGKPDFSLTDFRAFFGKQLKLGNSEESLSSILNQILQKHKPAPLAAPQIASNMPEESKAEETIVAQASQDKDDDTKSEMLCVH